MEVQDLSSQLNLFQEHTFHMCSGWVLGVWVLAFFVWICSGKHIQWFCLEVLLDVVVIVIWQLKLKKKCTWSDKGYLEIRVRNPIYVALISCNIQRIILMSSVYDNAERSVKAKLLRDNSGLNILTVLHFVCVSKNSCCWLTGESTGPKKCR